MVDENVFRNASVLITGGTGSFGRAFARKLLEQDLCRRVIIFSRDEWKQWEMQQSDPLFCSSKIRYFLGDVRDRDRLERAFHDVNIVIHAAALKQVPAAEYNPSEFIKTNIFGAMNIIDAAIDQGVQRVIALSTDKSVNPINLYGATKLCSDKLFVGANVYVGARGFPKFSIVRYGNVIGSRGSIISLWKQQVAAGIKSLIVTDERMTRFWITLEQAVNFVIARCADMEGGEIFVAKIPSMKILDLARSIAPALQVSISGLRPGEKLHELMVSIDDARHTYEYPHYYTILPETWSHLPGKVEAFLSRHPGGNPLPENFAYTSDTNKEWLGLDDMRKVIAEH